MSKQRLYQIWYNIAFTYHPLPGGIKPKMTPRAIIAFNSNMRWVRDSYPSLTDDDYILAMHYMFIHNPLFLDSPKEYLNFENCFHRTLKYYIAWKRNNHIDPRNINTWKEPLLAVKPEYEVFLMSLLDE